MKKLLILSVGAGAGHIRAAQALQEQAKTDFPTWQVEHVDVLELGSQAFHKLYSEGYVKLIKRSPEFWRYLYNQSNEAAPDALGARLKRQLERLSLSKFTALLERVQPDIVVCTHFLPAELLMHQIQSHGFQAPVYVVITDFDLHAYWLIPNMTGFFCANQEVAWRLEASHLAPVQALTTGIPIHAAFHERIDPATARQEMGLDSQKTTLLLMMGGLGMGNPAEVCEKLLRLHPSIQIIAVAGKNQEAYLALSELKTHYPDRLLPFAFTDQIPRLMAASDLVVTKPGGLSTSECLAQGKPMLLFDPIPGQEERNADYLVECGAALKALDLLGLEFKLSQLLAMPEKLKTMASAAQAIAPKRPAQKILEQLNLGFGLGRMHK